MRLRHSPSLCIVLTCAARFCFVLWISLLKTHIYMAGLRRVLHENAKAGVPDAEVLSFVPPTLQGHVQGEDQRAQGKKRGGHFILPVAQQSMAPLAVKKRALLVSMAADLRHKLTIATSNGIMCRKLLLIGVSNTTRRCMGSSIDSLKPRISTMMQQTMRR